MSAADAQEESMARSEYFDWEYPGGAELEAVLRGLIRQRDQLSQVISIIKEFMPVLQQPCAERATQRGERDAD